MTFVRRIVEASRHRVSRFRTHISSPADVWLLARMLIWALVLPLLKHVLPLRHLARLAYREARGGGRLPERERQVVAFARWLSRPFSSPQADCLQRSLLIYLFLSEINASPHLIVGVRKGSEAVFVHAWVIAAGVPVGESEASLREFVPVVAFGAGGLPVPLSSFPDERGDAAVRSGTPLSARQELLSSADHSVGPPSSSGFAGSG
jgi:hypothetical protein